MKQHFPTFVIISYQPDHIMLLIYNIKIKNKKLSEGDPTEFFFMLSPSFPLLKLTFHSVDTETEKLCRHPKFSFPYWRLPAPLSHVHCQ